MDRIALGGLSGLFVLGTMLGSAACGLSVVGTGGSSTTDGGTTATPIAADGGATSSTAAAIVGKSCKDLLARVPTLAGQDGLRTVDPDGDGPNAPFTVYCDMSTDGGGWTLAGRSAVGGTGDFGWGTKTGSASDTTKPYALDTYDAGIIFEAVLLRSADRAYVLDIPPSFAELTQSTEMTVGARTVLGDCAPTNRDGDPVGPKAFWYLGDILSTSGFFFRDTADNDGRYGLRPDGWNTPDGSCNKDASLDGEQGAVYIR